MTATSIIDSSENKKTTCRENLKKADTLQQYLRAVSVTKRTQCSIDVKFWYRNSNAWSNRNKKILRKFNCGRRDKSILWRRLQLKQRQLSNYYIHPTTRSLCPRKIEEEKRHRLQDVSNAFITNQCHSPGFQSHLIRWSFFYFGIRFVLISSIEGLCMFNLAWLPLSHARDGSLPTIWWRLVRAKICFPFVNPL